MRLSTLLLLSDIEYQGSDHRVRHITDDSRKCRQGSIFVSKDADEKNAENALENGAVLVVAEKKLCERCAVCENAAKAYAVLCREFFSRPDECLRLVAVTGTNGKTSVSTMIYHILSACGKKAGLIGTVKNISDASSAPSLTTPDCFELYSLLRRMADSHKQFCVLEASSQGLSQLRLYPMRFEIGVFTNLTHDHLDYHKTLEEYKNAKLSLFSHCETGIINLDDKCAEQFISRCTHRAVTYSLERSDADFIAKNVSLKLGSVKYALVSNGIIQSFTLGQTGDIWVQNSMAAAIACLYLGIEPEKSADALKSFGGVSGRMEFLQTEQPFAVVIDYAHTADGLKRTLLSLRKSCSGRLICLFGCGGDRDRQKRAEMGKIAAELSDAAVVTSDNPRTEPPLEIIDDILEGMKKTKTPVFIEENRKKAIELALRKARAGDIVLLAGKGHETYQLVDGQKLDFDERKIVYSILRSSAWRAELSGKD